MGINSYYMPCIRRRYTTTNENGRRLKTYESTSINGYLGSRSQNTFQIADQDTVITKFKFYCDDFDLAFDDIIVYEGVQYRVSSDPQNTVHRGHHIKTELVRIGGVT